MQLAGMLGNSLGSHWPTAGASLALVSLSWFVILLAENSRIPVDDPNTHLELTMIHEVMVLDHGGPLYGLVLYGAAIKLFVQGALLVRLVAPIGGLMSGHPAGDFILDRAVFLAGMLLLAVAIG